MGILFHYFSHFTYKEKMNEPYLITSVTLSLTLFGLTRDRSKWVTGTKIGTSLKPQCFK